MKVVHSISTQSSSELPLSAKPALLHILDTAFFSQFSLRQGINVSVAVLLQTDRQTTVKCRTNDVMATA